MPAVSSTAVLSDVAEKTPDNAIDAAKNQHSSSADGRDRSGEKHSAFMPQVRVLSNIEGHGLNPRCGDAATLTGREGPGGDGVSADSSNQGTVDARKTGSDAVAINRVVSQFFQSRSTEGIDDGANTSMAGSDSDAGGSRAGGSPDWHGALMVRCSPSAILRLYAKTQRCLCFLSRFDSSACLVQLLDNCLARIQAPTCFSFLSSVSH